MLLNFELFFDKFRKVWGKVWMALNILVGKVRAKPALLFPLSVFVFYAMVPVLGIFYPWWWTLFGIMFCIPGTQAPFLLAALFFILIDGPPRGWRL